MKFPMIFAAAALAATGAANAAFVPGTPITSPPPTINALGGQVVAVYVFADAKHTDLLGLTTPPAMSVIFCNHSTGSCTGGNAGDTVPLGNRNGLLTFTLHDNNTGNTFNTNSPDADNNYHAWVTTNYADFNEGALPAAAAAVLAGLSNVTFVGWEDKTMHDSNPDWDYNDLIFAFSATKPSNNAPEPLTLSLVGAGLLGAFGLRRVKKS